MCMEVEVNVGDVGESTCVYGGGSGCGGEHVCMEVEVKVGDVGANSTWE